MKPSYIGRYYFNEDYSWIILSDTQFMIISDDVTNKNFVLYTRAKRILDQFIQDWNSLSSTSVVGHL